jgi:hypothetical protein
MDDKTRFAVYCLEEYKVEERLTGKSAIELFLRNQVLEYVRKYYDSLHTTGRQYIVNDIKGYIGSRKLTQ